MSIGRMYFWWFLLPFIWIVNVHDVDNDVQASAFVTVTFACLMASFIKQTLAEKADADGPPDPEAPIAYTHDDAPRGSSGVCTDDAADASADDCD